MDLQRRGRQVLRPQPKTLVNRQVKFSRSAYEMMKSKKRTYKILHDVNPEMFVHHRTQADRCSRQPVEHLRVFGVYDELDTILKRTQVNRPLYGFTGMTRTSTLSSLDRDRSSSTRAASSAFRLPPSRTSFTLSSSRYLGEVSNNFANAST